MAILDKLFLLFHTSLIIFVLVGWLWERTRLAHLVMASLIALSWFGLGACYGIGYCPFTDWHWQVRKNMGETDLPLSYIKFLLDSFLGTDLNSRLVDNASLLLFFAAFLLSAFLSWRDLRGRSTSL